ncbi:efflux RND transporter periplasmic adaptor subunit [Cytophaga aurantiaca]|uniref:efflux RND transporter periplasmic adaptor subunit n=1 Tax=Cytophaga aurantiaca TaxID=29530 RepID=UPI00037C78EB|nr:efflux RND transporter periplasmic adaptor subunit [Cytophaga aurantiaca]
MRYTTLLTTFIFCIAGIFSCKKKTATIQPIVKDITESVYASGKIKAAEQYAVFATVNGILKQAFVKPGDTIQKGAKLFLLDDQTSDLSNENARINLELSEENSNRNSDKLKEFTLAKNIAYNKFQLDSSIYMKQKHLWEMNIGTEIEFEQKKLAYQTSRSNYEITNSQYAQAKRQLATDAKVASNNYNITKKQQADYTIKSLMNGTVYDVLKEQGELVTPQTQLAVIGLSNQFIIELEIDEKDISRIKLNQHIEINMDSYKGQVFEGVITSIYPIMNERTRTFTVKAQFINQPPTIYPNLSVEANIIIHTKKNALVIPTSYLLNGSTVLLEDNKAIPVKTGLQNYDYVEILEGIKSTDILYKP